MKKTFIATGILVGLLLLIFSALFVSEKENRIAPLSSDPDSEYVYTTSTVQIAGKTIQVDLAQTPAELSRGLSGRRSLAEGTGMLFIFENPDTYGFWMKDMLFPIDIIWIDEGKIIHIEKNISPDTYPEIFTPNSPAKYVLEVPAGFSDKNGLKIGGMIIF